MGHRCGPSYHNFKSTEVLRERLRLLDIKPKSIKINNTSIVIVLKNYAGKHKLLSMLNLLGIDINYHPYTAISIHYMKIYNAFT